MDISIYLKINTKEKSIIQDALSVYREYLKKEYDKSTTRKIQNEISVAMSLTTELMTDIYKM